MPGVPSFDWTLFAPTRLHTLAGMRIYEGAPRQNYQEVLRSIGAYLDTRGMREILVLEVADGFVVQGLTPLIDESKWTEAPALIQKETLSFIDDDIARFMDEAIARRGTGEAEPEGTALGFYEDALRVLGLYIDGQKPQDVFLLEQEHSFVLRLLMPGRSGPRHVLAEFTSDDVAAMVANAPAMRGSAEVGLQPAG